MSGASKFDLKLTGSQRLILAVNVLQLVAFAGYYLTRQNYEFIMYVLVMITGLAIVLSTHRRVRYPDHILWGLTVWGLMHMGGGSIPVGDGRLYEWMIIPISDDVFRYDQLVHIFGFGVMTLFMYHLMRPLLLPGKGAWVRLFILVTMMGLGVGALNEIIEFIIDSILPETGVGDYVNTSLDLIADLLGAIPATIYVLWREGHFIREKNAE